MKLASHNFILLLTLRQFRHVVIFIILIQPTLTMADALITGKIKDIYNRPVVGGKVTIKHGNELLQETVTGVQGDFGLEISFGEFGTTKLKAEHSKYVAKEIEVEIVNYEPSESSYLITMTPLDISSCIGARGAMYVGRFLPPPFSNSRIDLTPYVSRLLSDQIIPLLQIQVLRSRLDEDNRDLLPEFRPCQTASPLANTDAKPMAIALGGHGLVWGAVETGSPGYDIVTSVVDTVSALNEPLTLTSQNVDLDHPRNAVISPVIQAAVLISIMANLKHHGQCEAAIYVSNEIDRLNSEQDSIAYVELAALKQKASQMRSGCQESIPHAGLLGGTSK